MVRERALQVSGLAKNSGVHRSRHQSMMPMPSRETVLAGAPPVRPPPVRPPPVCPPPYGRRECSERNEDAFST
eukprot:591989-Prorocentrum_minimum.AAC.1